MNKKTLTALKGSIEKWKAIAAGTGVDRGAINCPLCNAFANFTTETPCDGCPVAQRTGDTNCDGSPYWDWFELEDTPHVSGRPFSEGMLAISDEAKAAAQKEVAFLESLLPVQP